VGEIPLGADNPIRIQSMTTTDTMDTIATVEQSMRMVDAGCDYVRITAPSKLEAENLLNIKNELRKRGYKVPLIADIHFTPNAAEIAARIVEKVVLIRAIMQTRRVLGISIIQTLSMIRNWKE